MPVSVRLGLGNIRVFISLPFAAAASVTVVTVFGCSSCQSPSFLSLSLSFVPALTKLASDSDDFGDFLGWAVMSPRNAGIAK